MNKKPYLSLFLVVATLVLATGCKNPPPTTVSLNTDQDHTITGAVTSQVTSNINVGVQGSGNPTNGDWTAGVVITFKSVPDQTTQWALQAADAVPVTTERGVVWRIAKADWSNPEFRQAMQLALKSGATITGFKI